MSKNNNPYKGCLEALVIQLIDQNGSMYGYEITQKAKELTAGKLKITEGTLYPLLHKLEDDGILISYFEEVGNRPRKYYKIANTGGDKVKETKDSLQEFIQHLQAFLQPKII
jgi:PadR family transcriptional regulator PadR